MAFNERETNPSLIPVQLNVKIPFQLREDMIRTAEVRGISQAELVRLAIEVSVAPEVARFTREQTKDAGATK